MDLAKQSFEEETNTLKDKISEISAELDLYKKRYQEEEERKIARQKAERDKIAEKRRKVIILLILGRTTYQVRQCGKVYPELIFSLEVGRRRKEKEEKEMIGNLNLMLL